MRVATFVDGVLLAAIIFVWIWTWWWNRQVTQHFPEPDFDAATVRLTVELILIFGPDTEQVPLEAHRAAMARNVVNAAFDDALWKEEV